MQQICHTLGGEGKDLALQFKNYFISSLLLQQAVKANIYKTKPTGVNFM